MEQENQQFDQILSELKGLKSDVTSLKTDVTSLKTGLSDLKTKVSDIEEKMATKQDIDEVLEVVIAIKDNAVTQEQFMELDQKVSGVITRVASNKTDHDAFEQSVGQIDTRTQEDFVAHAQETGKLKKRVKALEEKVFGFLPT